MAVLTGLGDITVLGCGKMGGAIVGGLVMLDGFDTSRLHYSESTEDHCSQVTDAASESSRPRMPRRSSRPSASIIAVKPQVARGILEDLVVSQPLDGMLVISIAAGMRHSQLGLPRTLPSRARDAQHPLARLRGYVHGVGWRAQHRCAGCLPSATCSPPSAPPSPSR